MCHLKTTRVHSLLVRLQGHYDRPALAKSLDVAGHFWLAHWKWIITMGITTGVMLLKLR